MDDEEDQTSISSLHRQLFAFLDIKCPLFKESVDIKTRSGSWSYRIPKFKDSRMLLGTALMDLCLQMYNFTEFYILLMAVLQEFSIVFVSKDLQKISASMYPLSIYL